MIEFKKYNKIAGIYKFENKINHKCYIGQSIDIGSRLRHHIGNFKHRRYDAPLYRAFDKYGIESFDVEILYSIENPIPDVKILLDQLEIGYIEKYNSYGGTGYNQTRGADAGILGYKFTEEQRKRTSENSRIAAKQYSTRVWLYNLESGWTFSFPSIMSAANHFNCSHAQITRLCRWKQLTLNNKKIIPLEQREKIRSSMYKYIIEVYENDKLVKIYNTSKELNDDLFKHKDPRYAINNIRSYQKHGWKYRGIYTFKLIDKKNI